MRRGQAFGKTTRTALAVSLAASGVLALAATPAQAAPKPKKKCYTGQWVTTGLTAKITGKSAQTGYTQNVTYKGMAGIKLKLDPKKGLVYNFTGSKRETFAGVNVDGKRVEGWEQLKGVLYLPAKITGDRKGVITSRNKQARGPATGTGMNIKPERASWGTWKVADHAKIGHFDTPVVKKATFTCVPGKKLVVKDVRKWDTFTETLVMNLKPVKKKKS
ncbi:hypothetical protein LO762_03490 [Actinocorallia sp. API 0066]|uniref:hypothetical protein n=1 Tax=Actinocorallia sp. API 0066 TaxID=2896846 RepID=UPI001E2FAEAE|nr:hypothetical protein [Actinocorallia sp. API 0066]MCD0448262.1 hypothetical protein [Actinocorallia sp. API 0066]